MEEDLKKQTNILQRENDWKTERAVLAQKLELQELQIQELKVREENYKKFNDTILQAYNTLDNSKHNSKIFQQVQQSLEQYSRDLLEQKHKNSESVTQLEAENRDLKSKNLQLIKEVELLNNQLEELQEALKNKTYSVEDREKDKYQFQKIHNEFQQQLNQVKRDYEQQFSDMKRQNEQLVRELDQKHQNTLSYHKEMAQKDREDLLKRLDENRKSHNKENISPQQQQFHTFKCSSPQNEPEPYSFKGCIVTAKSKRQHKREETCETYDVQTERFSIRDRDRDVSYREHLMNCKNSNVMEINLLQSSDIFKAVTGSGMYDNMQLDQSSLSNVNGLVQQLQREKSQVKQFLSEFDERSPVRERENFQSQIFQFANDLRRAKDTQEDEYPRASDKNNLLKHEIKFMINKLLRAKGHLNDTITCSLNVSMRPSTEKSLTNFSKQLNQAKSIENFTNMIQTEGQTHRSRRFAASQQKGRWNRNTSSSKQ